MRATTFSVGTTPFAIAIIALLTLLFVLERRVALRRSRRPLLGRLLVNACLSGLAFDGRGVAGAPGRARRFAGGRRTGPLASSTSCRSPATAQFVLSFLLMDLTFYWWHVANHRNPFLWRFHNVHHIDPDLDVSTAFRFHFGEVALSAGFRVMQVSAIGPSAWMFAAYELAFQANTRVSPQQCPLADPARAAAEPDHRHSADARHPPLSGAHRNQLELFRGLLVVGRAAPDPGPQCSPVGPRHRGPRLFRSRRTTAS